MPSFLTPECCKLPEECSTVVFVMGFLFFLELLKLRFARGLRCHPDCTVSLSAALNCILFLYLDKKLVYAGCPSVRSKNLETIKGLVLNVWSRSKKVLHPAIISFSPTCYWNARPTYNYQKDQCMCFMCLGLSIHVTGPLQHRSLRALKRRSTHQDISCRTSKDPKLWMAGQFIAGRNQPSW